MLLQFTVVYFVIHHISADCGHFGSTPLNQCTLASSNSSINDQSSAISHIYRCDKKEHEDHFDNIYTERTYSTSNCAGDYTVANVTHICDANVNHCSCNQTKCATHTALYSEDCAKVGGDSMYMTKDYVMNECIGKIGGGSEMYTCPKVEGGEATHEEWDDAFCSCNAEEVTANPKCATSHDYDVPCDPHYFQYPIDECVQIIRDPALQSIKYTCNETRGNISYYKHLYDGYHCGGEEMEVVQLFECDQHPSSSCSCSVTTEECDSFLSFTYENCYDKTMERVMPDVCVPGDMVDLSDNEEHDTWVKYSCNSNGYTTLDIYYDETCAKKEKECPLEYVYDCDYQMDGKRSLSDDDVCGYILDDNTQRNIPMDFCYKPEESEDGLLRKAGCEESGLFFINMYTAYPCDDTSFVQQLNVTDECAQSGACQCGKGAACHVATEAACDDPDDPTFAFLVGQCLYGVIEYECDDKQGPKRTFWKNNCTERCEDTSTSLCMEAKDGFDRSLCAHYRGKPLDYCMMDDPFTSYKFTYSVGKFYKVEYKSAGCSGNSTTSALDECNQNNGECFHVFCECFVPDDYKGDNTHCNVVKSEYCDANMFGVTDIVNYTVTDLCILEDNFENFPVKYSCKNGEITSDYSACTQCNYTASHKISDAELCEYASSTSVPLTTSTTHAHHDKSGKKKSLTVGISIAIVAGVILVIGIFVYLHKRHEAKQLEKMDDKYETLLDEKDNL